MPTYHEIVEGEAKYVYSVGAPLVDAHLAVLRQLRLEPQPPPATFDDAHRTQYEFGLPALQRHQIHGIFFAIPERANSWPNYMRWNELRELISLGHEVQSHGFSHVPLTRCSDTDLRREVELSKSTLQDKLGTPVDSISIPFGRWDKRVLEACRRAGYARIYTSDPRPYAVRSGVELIGRFMVRNSMTAERFRQMLLAAPASLALMRAKLAAKRALRRLVGDRNYHLLWCYLSGEDSENIKSEYV